MAKQILRSNPREPHAWLVLTMPNGIESDQHRSTRESAAWDSTAEGCVDSRAE
jgi:hypothetical protein